MVAGLELAREVSRRSVSRQVRLVIPNFGLNVTVLGAALRKRIAAGDTERVERVYCYSMDRHGRVASIVCGQSSRAVRVATAGCPHLPIFLQNTSSGRLTVRFMENE